MSNSTQQDGIDILALQAGQLVTFLTFSASALYCYEWMVTLEQEVKYIWAQRWTLSTWIFAVNRYATLLFAVVSGLPTPTYDSCQSGLRSIETLVLLQCVVAALFSALRVFALSGRKIWLFLVVFSLNLVPVATNTFLTIMDTVEFAGTLDCDALLNSSEKVWSGLSISTRGCVILADVIVLVVTWMKANGTVREALRFRIEVPLSKILIRDGTLFFIVLLGVNTLVLLINNLPSTPLSLSVFGSTFLSSMPPIIISRFMLNLRLAANTSEDLQSNQEGSTAAQRSTIRFNSNSLVGNMGESLRFEAEDDDPGSGSKNERSGIEPEESDALVAEGSSHDAQAIVLDVSVV